MAQDERGQVAVGRDLRQEAVAILIERRAATQLEVTRARQAIERGDYSAGATALHRAHQHRLVADTLTDLVAE